MSGPDIFISYGREERPAARHFAESFAREGFSVWWDAVLRSGQTFDEVIERELRAAKAVVVLWSPRSVASRWVRAEATMADRDNKLVPVIIEACNLPIVFQMTHAADLSDWTGDTSDIRWQTLVSDLRRLVIGNHDEPEVAERESKPKSGMVGSPRPAPVARAETDRKAANVSKDELIIALERLTTPPVSELSKPTEAEEAQTQFYRRADEFRSTEGDKVHCLQRLDGEEQETRFVVGPAGLKIGRTAPADIIVTGSGVSRSHCLVELAGDKLRVTDLNSTNGTFVDNKRVDRSQILPVGSMLRVGSVTFEHEVRNQAEIDQPSDPLGLGIDAMHREARLARS